MERLGRVWTRLSVRRPTLPAVEPPDDDDDDDLPHTKNAVFEMFNESNAARHRQSELTTNSLRKRDSGDSSVRLSSSSPQRRLHSPGPTRSANVGIPVPKTSMTGSVSPTTSTTLDVPKSAHPLKRSTSFTEDSYNVSPEPSLQRIVRENNALSRMAETPNVVSPRRSSVFVKRGSVSMEPIKKVNLEDVYHVYKQLGTGRFGYIKLAEHKQSKQKIAIKFFPRPQIKQVDFVREYNYSFFLSPHPQIIDTYEGMYQAADDSAYFFVQEFCPKASLREAVEATNQQGLGEENTKKVFGAVLSAVEFMHNENLVHRNLKAENILLFDSHDFSKVIISSFCQSLTHVHRHKCWNPILHLKEAII
ncbi:hypothetical protein OESDEN_06322 [Oesophagostomum dentatum]|uniref:Protein kinase domain-containing protein n=1 Tax=Oesophagostomum dentatum TaxID=61180 RepID=A0A0B1TCC9_OESDE|nr:hypothetical protein OESDEN_06322 [Oesophagostomum dentatum]